MNNIDEKKRVTEVLRELSVPANLHGYEFLRDAIIYCLHNKRGIYEITKSLYPYVATKNESTTARVERTIRHAIGVSMRDVPGHILGKYINLTYDSRTNQPVRNPTNGEFIASIVDVLRIEFEEAAS